MSLLVGASKINESVIKFVESQIQSNPNVKLKNIAVKNTHKVDGKWRAYVLKIDAVFKGKDVSFGDIVFSNGKLIARDLIDLESSVSIKDTFSSLFSNTFYHKDNLVSGSSKSKHKIAVFSDPMCPYCQDLLPDLVEHAKKNTKDIALYYYHLPLKSIHPTADVVSRAMIVAHKRGIKNIVSKVYENRMSSGLSQEKALDLVNDALDLQNSEKITMSDIEKQDIIDIEKRDLEIASELLISGTPVVYIDGVKDNTRQKYQNIGK